MDSGRPFACCQDSFFADGDSYSVTIVVGDGCSIEQDLEPKCTHLPGCGDGCMPSFDWM